MPDGKRQTRLTLFFDRMINRLLRFAQRDHAPSPAHSPMKALGLLDDGGAAGRVAEALFSESAADHVYQCRKCRIPVNTIATPAASAAAITSASRMQATCNTPKGVSPRRHSPRKP